MHVRHRNGPGNGYRSNVLGVGAISAASQISPAGSMRGQRMYNEYRNNNRGGYGRGGHSKQSPRLTPWETDVFVEAGRLAAEYLVSKRVLPPDALSGKWLNDGVKNQVNNFQGFRQHEADKTPTAAGGPASTHSRLGNAALEVGLGRRRSPDEYDSISSRLSVRGRKRTGGWRNGGSEMKREFRRSRPWAETSGASPGMETDNDGFVGHNAELPGDKGGNGRMQSSSPGEAIQEVGSEVLLKSELEKCVDDMHANNGALNNMEYLLSDADEEPIKSSDDANEFNVVLEVPEEDRNDDSLQQKHVENKVESSTKGDALVSEDHVDLAKRCKFVNVPTKARSSLTKGKSVQNPMNEEGKVSKREPLGPSGAQVVNVDVGSSSCNDLSHQNHEFKSSQSDVSNDPSLEKELGVTYRAEPGQCMGVGSFPEISVYKEKELPDEGTSELQSPNSVFMERGAKQAIDYITDGREDSKKIKQEVSPLDAQSDGSSPLSSSRENEPPLQHPNTSQGATGTVVPDHKILDIPLIPKGEAANSCEFMEEKQLFPGSFKTCDLNLSGTCDATDNHEADPMIIFPSVTQPGEIGPPIDVDLSMGNNQNLPDKNCEHGVKDDIEVIDLENDSVQVHTAFNNPKRRADTLFNDLEGFPNNMHNANGIPDVQDGYGLMISELLGNDSPSCSSVRLDLNSLNNHMGLANTEGMLGDDDSIYMSLGEIPISLLGPWEQPMQDYGKPF